MAKRNQKSSVLFDGIRESMKEAIAKGGSAVEITEYALERVAYYCGGLVIYVPKSTPSSIKARNTRIKKEFTGNNHSALAKKYNLSMYKIYTILKEDD
ncbi:hypothetical protein HPC38_06800 [Pasteurellaceae bacterium HPA106]|uniref:Mor transcription activator family protein n=1 Tax=Spirabiliibacterium TaxID=2820724 RepID=UPI001AAD4694|nr:MULTISPECIES: Mor transcription activator family protein [Spirabiliibacterium]MBE2893461.1 hypothetical protein [Spirabiliibacterium falconis]MBE2896582.1 hypothetical protein [Spirabiliibacterium pneumoniae]